MTDLERQPRASKDEQSKMVIKGGIGSYAIIKKLAQTAAMRYYLCQDECQKWRIFCIAATKADNRVVLRAQDVLDHLAKVSTKLEDDEYDNTLKEVYADDFVIREVWSFRDYGDKDDSDDIMTIRWKLRQDPPTLQELELVEKMRAERLQQRLHYDWLFPVVTESFCCMEQGGRQVNILEIPDASLDDMTSLAGIPNKKMRLDLRSSAWIVGRMLKLQSLLCLAAVSASIGMSKFLIAPEHHRLVMLDWGDSAICKTVDWESSNLNVARAGIMGLRLIGATSTEDEWQYPYALENASDEIYIQCLRDMAALRAGYRGEYIWENRSMRTIAHFKFYETVDCLWGRKYHPFTTLPM